MNYIAHFTTLEKLRLYVCERKRPCSLPSRLYRVVKGKRELTYTNRILAQETKQKVLSGCVNCLELL